MKSEKMAMFKMLSFFSKNYFHGIKKLHANVQCVIIVCANYQMRAGKFLIQVEFPVHALSENTKSIMKKKSEKKILSSQCCRFVKKLFFQYQISSCKCSRCQHCVSKVSNANSKSSASSLIPRVSISENTKSL